MANFLSRNWRLVVLLLGIAVALWLMYLLRAVAFPFAFGMVLVYLVLPVVNWLEQRMPPPGRWMRFKRIIATLLVFVALLGLVAVFVYFVATVVIGASVILLQNAPNIIGRSIYQVQVWLEDVRQLFPPEMQGQIDSTMLEAGQALGNSIRAAVISGISFVPRNFSAILGFAALPFFLFYVIKDSEKLKRGFYEVLTPGIAEHARNVICIIERVLGRYIRAQLMLGLIVAYFSFLGMLILRVQFAPVLAILAGVSELIPTLGPWIGGGVAVIVTLAISPDKAIWVAVLYMGIQLLENSLLVPRIQGGYLHLHPAVMVVLLVVGAYVAGVWGLLLAGPLAATAVEIYKYVHRCCTLKPERAADLP